MGDSMRELGAPIIAVKPHAAATVKPMLASMQQTHGAPTAYSVEMVEDAD